MQFTPASTASLDVFLMIVVGVLGLAFAGIWYSARKTLGAQAGKRYAIKSGLKPLVWWGALLAFISINSLDASGDMVVPKLLLFFVACNLGAIAFGSARIGGMMAQHLPLYALVGFQAFRLPLELVLHNWAEGGTIPQTMTWTGANFDIISGIVALAAAPFAAKHRPVAWFANVVGFALLLNVMRVAVLSSPVPFGWQTQPPLLLAFHFPYVLIIPVCVGGALAGHVILTRRLLRRVKIPA